MAIDNGTKLSISWAAFDKRVIGLSSGQRTPLVQKTYELPFTDGAGAGKFTRSYAAPRTLPGGGAEDLDLAGVLQDTFGQTLSSARVKAWGVANTSVGGAPLVVGGTGGSNWTTCLNGTITLPAGALMALGTPDATGWTVTAGTGDLLHAAGTAGETYEVVFWIAES